MGNDFKRLLNPVEQPSPPGAASLQSSAYHHHQPAAASHYSPEAHPAHAVVDGNRPLPVNLNTPASPPREDRTDSRFGPSELNVHDPSSSSNLSAPFSWTPVNHQASIPSLLQNGSSSSRDGPAASEPRHSLWSQQQLTTHSAAQPQSTTPSFVVPKESRPSSAFVFGVASQASVRPVSNKVQPTTPPSPSPSPLQAEKSKLASRSTQDSSSGSTIPHRVAQPQSQSQIQREPRIVRFEDHPRDGPSVSPRHPHQSFDSQSNNPPHQYQLGVPATAASDYQDPQRGSSSVQGQTLHSTLVPYQQPSPSQTFSPTMENHVATSPGPKKVYSSFEAGASAPTQPPANGKCQRCQTLETASLNALDMDISGLRDQSQKMQPPATVDEWLRNADQLRYMLEYRRGKFECEECQRRVEAPGPRVSINIDGHRRERRKSSPPGSDADDGLPQSKKRKGPVNGFQTTPDLQNASLHLSPSPKCQSTPPPEMGTSSNLVYEIKTLSGESIGTRSGHLARLLDSKPSRSTWPPANAVASPPESDMFYDAELQKEKEKQRKDSGPAPVSDDV